MPGRNSASATDRAAAATAVAAFAMIAYQVAAKAARDATFLATYGIDALPRMIIATALFSIAAALLTSRLLIRLGPAKVVPGGFALSGILMLAIWPLYRASTGAAAIALYLHLSVGGSILISWFWSLVNERFDPRTAKRKIGRIAGGGTLGGVVGGLLAERVAAWEWIPPDTLLPMLAALHLACAGILSRIRLPIAGPPPLRREETDASNSWAAALSGLGILRRHRYLRDLGVLVVAGTIAATLLDFIFKSHAAARFAAGDELLRFFAVFHTATGVVTFIVQSTLTGRALQAAGPARTSATLPFAIGLGGTVLLFPWAIGLWTATVVRGLESVLRSSMFRSGYELFYTPVAAYEKRSTKALIDVGCDRLGDAIGGLAIQFLLLTSVVSVSGIGTPSGHEALFILAALVVIFALAGLAQGRRLHRGYVAALETSLLDHQRLAPDGVLADDATRTTFLRTVGYLDLSSLAPETPLPESAPPTTAPESPPTPRDPLLERIIALRSRDAAQTRSALSGPPLPPELVPHTIRLLGWDEVRREAIHALQSVGERHSGQLLDALLDTDEEFVIRRRIPRVLAAVATERVTDGLLSSLLDSRFEVRYQCGVALARIHKRRPELPIDRRTIHGAVRREVAVDRRVWESQRLLDQVEEGEKSTFFDEVLRKRTNRCLEHIFTVLSLTYPEQPLLIAFKGLHTDDEILRGTALEYLESILPAEIRDGLWPLLEDRRERLAIGSKSEAEILESLIRSHDSIRLNLEKLRGLNEGVSDDGNDDDRDRPDLGGAG